MAHTANVVALAVFPPRPLGEHHVPEPREVPERDGGSLFAVHAPAVRVALGERQSLGRIWVKRACDPCGDDIDKQKRDRTSAAWPFRDVAAHVDQPPRGR